LLISVFSYALGRSADAKAKELRYIDDALVTIFDNGNAAWEDIPEEDNKIKKIR
jgi:hypothetical protein